MVCVKVSITPETIEPVDLARARDTLYAAAELMPPEDALQTVQTANRLHRIILRLAQDSQAVAEGRQPTT